MSKSHISATPNDRISHLLLQIANELSNVKSSPEVVRSLKLIDEARQVIDGYDIYAAKHSTLHPAIVDKMLDASEGRDWDKLFQEGKTQFKLIPEMSAGGYEAVFLQQLAKISRAKTILEIGMFTGTTTVSLALLPTVEKVTTLDIEPFLKSINLPYFQQAGVEHKIDIRLDDASRSLEKLSEEKASFDMIFIDAHKPSYIDYFDRIMASPYLLAKGGLIVVDNTAFKASPWVPDPAYELGEGIHKFNEVVINNPNVDVVMLPVEDGISLIRRKGE